MFNENEIEALLLGARIVQNWSDRELATAAETAIDKIRAVSPASIQKQLDLVRLWAPVTDAREPITIDQASLRRAVRHRQKVRFSYRDMRDKSTDRLVWPLITALYGTKWFLAAWCEDREGFRVFRQDRMAGMIVLDETFESEPGRTAEDFLAQDVGPGGV
jgi:predicted DNA-binding transcriptional regulator YafY